MVYKIKYDSESDIMSIYLAEKGKLAYAEEMGDVVLHLDEKGRPLFVEIMNASKVVPAMVQALTKKEAIVVKA